MMAHPDIVGAVAAVVFIAVLAVLGRWRAAWVRADDRREMEAEREREG